MAKDKQQTLPQQENPEEREKKSLVPEVIDAEKVGEIEKIDSAEGLTETNAPLPQWLEDDPYRGMTQLETTDDQRRVLSRELKPDEIQVRPDGIVYMPGIYYTQRLNEAFGPGQWALYPVRDGHDQKNNQALYHGRLYVKQTYIAEAIGAMKYYPGGMSTYDDCYEGAMTNCLARCCKKLGIGSQMWMPEFVRKWRDKHCEYVPVKNVKKGTQDYFWLKKGQNPEPPFQRQKASAKPIDWSKHPIPEEVEKLMIGYFDMDEVEAKVKIRDHYSVDGVPQWEKLLNRLKADKAKVEKQKNGGSE